MKILCFGASNTYGYDPRSYFGSRYPAEHRWVDLLAEKLGCQAVNAGDNGREIPRREEELRHFEWLLSRNGPPDRLLIMLGANDLLQGNAVETVARRMEAFLAKIPLEKEKIVLIGLPRMRPGAWITEERLLEDCVRLNTAYRTVTEKLGIRFIDTTDWDIAVTFDGVHFSERGHQVLAEKLYLSLKEV